MQGGGDHINILNTFHIVSNSGLRTHDTIELFLLITY